MRKRVMTWIATFVLFGSANAAIDANTASKDALQRVTGIGPSIAERIVAERRKGPYKNLADLEARVKGIGESKARKMVAGGLTVSNQRTSPTDRRGGDAVASARGSQASAGVPAYVGGRMAAPERARR